MIPKVVLVISALQERLMDFFVIKTLRLVVFWEPNVKQSLVVFQGKLIVARNIIMHHYVIVANRRQQGLVRYIFPKHLQISCHDRIKDVKSFIQGLVVSQRMGHEISIQNDSIKIAFSLINALQHVLDQSFWRILAIDAHCGIANIQLLTDLDWDGHNVYLSQVLLNFITHG